MNQNTFLRPSLLALSQFLALTGTTLLLTLGYVQMTGAGGLYTHSWGRRASLPADLSTLIEKATEAVNTGKPDSLAPFLSEANKNAFAWLSKASTKKWTGDLLPIPNNPTTQQPSTTPYLAVFHAWHTCESDGDHVHFLEKTAEGWKLGPEIPETETLGLRVRDHDLKVSLDIPQKRVAITDQVRLERVQPKSVGFGLLRLSNDFQVQKLTVNGKEIPFQQSGGVIAFLPPTGKNSTLSMQYAGRVDHHEGDYLLPNEVVLNSYWYPHIARLPATTTVTVTVPPGWTPLAQGNLVHESRTDTGVTVTYRNDIPNCYFTLDAGRYHIFSRLVKGRVLTAYLLSENAKLGQECLDELAAAMAFYEANFSPYPYKQYAVVESQGPFPGALEAYSFATYGPGALPGAIAHELAHTWWGGLVPCTYTRSMWNESFADYSDALFERQGKHTGPNRSLRQQPPKSPPFSVFPMTEAGDTSDGRQASVGYGKGALVLRVLEEELGQEKMLACIKAFLAQHPHGEAAEWNDFEAVVNRVTRQDYRWFFAQWAERTGLPTVQLTNVTTKKVGLETVIEGDILQEGTPYKLHVPVRLETKTLPALIQIVLVNGSQTHFTLRTKGVPTRLTLDPDAVLPLLPSPKVTGTDGMTHTFGE